MATEKVLYVITKGNVGGAQRYVYDLARSLPKKRYEAVIAVGGDGGWLQEVGTAGGIRVVTVPELGRDVSIVKDFGSLGTLVTLFKKEKPDVVHLNSSKAGAVGALAARIAGVKKIIFTVHGWAFNEKRGTLSRSLFWLAHLVTMLLVDITIANSAATAGQAPITKGLVTVPIGVAPIEFLSREDARQKLEIDEGFIIGTIAELHKNKGLDVLIDALARLPDARVVVIGGGEKKHALKARALARGVVRRINFVGPIVDAARYLKAFDIFVLPSRTESSGYVLLEAGLAGLPVVATNVGGIPEIIEDGVTGLLVPTENAPALAEAIQKLTTDANLRTQYGTALKSKVLRDFSLEKMITKTLAVYD